MEEIYMRLITTLTLILSLANNSYAADIGSVISNQELIADAERIVSALGLNCGTPNNYPLFLNEFYKVMTGFGQFSSELALQTGTAKKFPNICNVLTQPQIDSYSETPEKTYNRKCVLIRPWPLKGCLKFNNITTTQPRATYWWPKYLIEVSEKGNDFHSSFVEGNKILAINRSIARGLTKFFDVGGVTKLVGLMTGSASLLKAVGVNLGSTSDLKLGQALALSPSEAMRITAGSGRTLTTYEANIWPIVSSKTLASKLTVCGPQITDAGGDPGGYAWPYAGVPMTCPVATSTDAYSYWDSGILDYIDPEAAIQVAAASNPLTCGMAAGMEYLASQGKFQGEKVGDQSKYDKESSGSSQSKSLSNCSSPVLGTTEAIVKKSMSTADMKKWSQVKCTLWGSIAPKSAITAYDNDYSYANTALKFKLFSHELFGVPRGDQERWSLAYPWEGGGGSTNSTGDSNTGGAISKTTNIKGQFTKNFTDTISKITSGKIKLGFNSANRSEGLFVVGDPSFINASTSSKYWLDRTKQITTELAYIGGLNAATSSLDPASRAGAWIASEGSRYATTSSGGQNSISGNRRIYTIWEKIKCKSKTTKVENSFPPLIVYKSCQDTIQYEVYKYIQLKLLRKICNALKQEEGAPWK